MVISKEPMYGRRHYANSAPATSEVNLATEEYPFELNQEQVTELVDDVIRAVTAKIHNTVDGSLPPQLNFVCGPDIKITYQRDKTMPGAVAYTIYESNLNQVGEAPEALVVITNHNDKSNAHFQVESSSGTYYVHFWTTDTKQLQKISNAVQAFMFDSVSGLRETLQGFGTVSQNTQELREEETGIRVFAQNILKKLSSVFRGKK
jgi:hypothetical protein